MWNNFIFFINCSTYFYFSHQVIRFDFIHKPTRNYFLFSINCWKSYLFFSYQLISNCFYFHELMNRVNNTLSQSNRVVNVNCLIFFLFIESFCFRFSADARFRVCEKGDEGFLHVPDPPPQVLHHFQLPLDSQVSLLCIS